MKYRYAVAAIFTALVLASCNETSSITPSLSSSTSTSLGLTDQERVNAAINTGAIALYQSKGTVVNPTRTNTHESDDGAISVATSITIEGEAVALAWTATPSSAATIGNADSTGRRLITFSFPVAGSTRDVTLTVTATYNAATATLNYPFKLETPIAESSSSIVPEGILKTIEEARQITVAPSGSTPLPGQLNIMVEGYVTSVMADGNNLTIQQGGLALGLFNPVNAGANQRPFNFSFGDYIRARGTFDRFNGLNQLRVTVLNGFIEAATAPVNAVQPEIYEIMEADWAGGATGGLLGKDGAYVKMTDLRYVSGLDNWNPTAGVHYSSLVFRKGNTNVNFYINYHILLPNMQAIRALIAANPTASFTYQGALGWSSGPSISPMSAAELVVQS
jgi:hypothetical protein